MQSVGQKKNKTHRKRCNYRECSIQSRANYKINLNHKSEFSY